MLKNVLTACVCLWSLSVYGSSASDDGLATGGALAVNRFGLLSVNHGMIWLKFSAL